MTQPMWLSNLKDELEKPEPDISVMRELIVEAYVTDSGEPRPKTSDELRAISRWFYRTTSGLPIHAYFFKWIQMLTRVASVSLSDKISSLAQFNCPLCGNDASGQGAVIPIIVPPESKQSIAGRRLKLAFERAIASEINDLPRTILDNTHVCLHIVFVVGPSRRSRDVDNMAKALIDAIKHKLFGDDRLIDHLNILRIDSDSEEYIYVQLRPSQLNAHDDVLFPVIVSNRSGKPAVDL